MGYLNISRNFKRFKRISTKVSNNLEEFKFSRNFHGISVDFYGFQRLSRDSERMLRNFQNVSKILTDFVGCPMISSYFKKLQRIANISWNFKKVHQISRVFPYFGNFEDFDGFHGITRYIKRFQGI